MNDNVIYVTQNDFDRLNRLLVKNKPHNDNDKALQKELNRAKIVSSQDIPPDVITMNSRIIFSDESGKNLEYNLVFPDEADVTQNKISILSPIGTSLIGYKVGSTVKIPTPKGEKSLIVKQIVYQPERAGDFNL